MLTVEHTVRTSDHVAVFRPHGSRTVRAVVPSITVICSRYGPTDLLER